MVKAAKATGVFAIAALAAASIVLSQCDRPRAPKREVVCKDKYLASEQANIDKLALGGDLAAMVKRAACSWPLDERDQSVLKPPAQPSEIWDDQVKDAVFWTALHKCRISTTRTSSMDILRQAQRAYIRFDRAKEALDLLDDPEGAQFEVQTRYQQRLAVLGAAGIAEVARHPDCPFSTGTIVKAGAVGAATESWASRKEMPNVAPWNSGKDGWDPKDRDDYYRRTLSDEQKAQAELVKQAFLAGILGDGGAQRAQVAISHMDRFGIADLNWLLYDLRDINGFDRSLGGGATVSGNVYSSATSLAIGALERLVNEGNWPGKDDDPPILGNLDNHLTNEETRNLVCWAASQGPPRPTKLIVLGQLAWMYANGYGYPKNLFKASQIINNVLSRVEELESVLKQGSEAQTVIKDFKPFWMELQKFISDDLGARGRSRSTFEQFSATRGFLCPGKFNVKNLEVAHAGAERGPLLAREKQPAPANAIGFGNTRTAPQPEGLDAQKPESPNAAALPPPESAPVAPEANCDPSGQTACPGPGPN